MRIATNMFVKHLSLFSPKCHFPVKCHLTGAGHGDDGPVQGLGQSVEHRVRLILLERVGQASEYQHPHADRHGEQQQLPGEWRII